MSTNDSSAATKRQPLGPEGHIGATFYMRDDTTFRVVYDPELMGGSVTVYIGSFGGSVSLCVTPEQWTRIAEAVESVLPQAVEA